MKWCLPGREYCFDTKYPNGGFCHVQLYHIGKSSYYASWDHLRNLSAGPSMEAQWLTVKARLVMFCKTPMPLLGVTQVSNHVRVFTRSISKPPWWVLGMSAVPWQKERYLMNSADWSEINLRRAKNACPLVCFLVVKGKHLTPFSFSTCKPIPAITVAPRFPTQPRCKDTTGARVLTSTEKETHNRLFRCPTEINLSGIPTKQMSERNYEPHPDWCFPSLENMHVVDALDNSSSNNHIN